MKSTKYNFFERQDKRFKKRPNINVMSQKAKIQMSQKDIMQISQIFQKDQIKISHSQKTKKNKYLIDKKKYLKKI